MTDNTILELIGLTYVAYHKKYKETKSIEDLALEMLNQNSPLYFMHKHYCVFNCFPATHIITEGDVDLATKAMEGKGLFGYADQIRNLSNNSNLTPGIDNVMTPFASQVGGNDVVNLIAMNDADSGGACPHANNCPYLKVLKDKIVGRPCPFVIKNMIQNMIYFTDIFIKHKKEMEELETISIDDLSYSEKIAIPTEASKKTKAEFLSTFESFKSMVSWTKDGFQTTIVTNDSNKQSNDIQKTINESLIKQHGIDQSAKTKTSLKDRSEKRKTVNEKKGKTSNLLFQKPKYLNNLDKE